MRFTVSALDGQDTPDFLVDFMAERLVERRLSHALPLMWVAMFRPVEPIPGVELLLAIHYQTRSIQELATADWFTAKEVRGFSAERGWTTFRTVNAQGLDGVRLGPSQFVREA